MKIKERNYLKELIDVVGTPDILRLGKGYSHSNLYNMRKIYELYPIFQPLDGKLVKQI